MKKIPAIFMRDLENMSRVTQEKRFWILDFGLRRQI